MVNNNVLAQFPHDPRWTVRNTLAAVHLVFGGCAGSFLLTSSVQVTLIAGAAATVLLVIDMVLHR